MKITRRFCVFTLVMILFATMSVNVFAANTTNEAFTFTIVSGQKVIPPRQKLDNSEHYYYQNGGTVATASVISRGQHNNSSSLSTGINCTWSNGVVVPSVSCRRGTQYNIHNGVGEGGYSWAKLIISNLTEAGSASGVWSPDSIGTYISARP